MWYGVRLLTFLYISCLVYGDNELIVKTQYGLVEGYFDSNETVRAFLGIPFASPPIDELRWKPPVAPQSWTGIRPATKYSHACTQPTGGSEDCLYLNVWTPINFTAPLPVMVLIYGGGFTAGGGQSYNGTNLATNDVIFVSPNYRLGVFGFLALESLYNENPDMQTTGNYALFDQRFALEWVQNNIAQFGGDPNQVTIFGGSAGAVCICYHLAASRSEGLFTGAIMQSGNCYETKPLETAIEQGNLFLNTTNCTLPSEELSCLRSLSTQDVYSLYEKSGASFIPVVDNYDLTQTPMDYLIQGDWNKVPTILGTNQNELGSFFCPKYENLSASEYEAIIVGTYGEKYGPVILSYYPVDQYATPTQALIAVFSDQDFICPTQTAAEAIANSSINSFLYEFSYIPDWSNSCEGCGHGMEIPFLFPTYLAHHPLNAQEKQLSKAMTSYWTNFANTENPNDGQLFKWPFCVFGNEENIVLNLPFSVELNYRQEYCDLWDELLPYLPNKF